jgi:REP element-mobilizing transposase RayT
MHVPGDGRGWVDRARGNHRGGYQDPSSGLVGDSIAVMTQLPYQLDLPRARTVLDAIREVCQFRRWDLLAALVRTTHVHVVVSGPADPNRAITDFKAYSSRALSDRGFEARDCKRWSRGGSTRALGTSEAIWAAIGYVVDQQGEPMAVYATASPR